MTEPSSGHAAPRGAHGPLRPYQLFLFVLAYLVVFFGLYEVIERVLLAPRLSMEALHLLHLLRGIASSLLLAGFVAWYQLRGGVPVFPPSPGLESSPAILDLAGRSRQHAYWFIHARWVAVGIILGLIVISVPITHLLPRETLLPLLLWWSVLPLANIVFHWSVSRLREPDHHVMTQAIADLVVLTGLLNASGGIENPLYVSYIFHVIITAIILPKRRSLVITGAALGLFLTLVVGEATQVLPHYTNRLFPHARFIESKSGPILAHLHAPHAAHDPVFVTGEAGSFVVVLLLAAWLTMLVADRLRQSEERLERTARLAVLEQKRLESVVHAARVGIIVLDPDLTVRWFSQLVSDWLKWDASVIGRRCPLYGPPGGQEDGPAIHVVANGHPAEAERTIPGPGGSLQRFRHVASPVHDGAGAVVQVVEVVEDITVRRALEAEALHADKMSVLGRMAAGIAHEIGNPLSSMGTRLRLMESRSDPEYLQRSLTLLQGQVHRIARIVHGVSEFARMPRHEWMTWDVNGAVEDAMLVAELDPRFKQIEFQCALAAASPRVRGVRDQVVQVVLNLLLNAAEAMSDSGKIVVETSRRNGEVAISVQDSGLGMDENMRARLFEPFFTTKPHGVGLGLSVSHTLVHAHGGRFEVESEPGKGSRITVVLPAAEVVPVAKAGA